MEFKITYPNKEDIEKTNAFALVAFGDPEAGMVVPNMENALAVIELEKNNFVCIKEDDEPIAWSLVLPTRREDMEEFLVQKITEQELFDRAKAHPSFESLYIFAAITRPEYRLKGLAAQLLEYQIGYFKKQYGVKDFYAWILTPEGKALTEALEKKFGEKVRAVSRV